MGVDWLPFSGISMNFCGASSGAAVPRLSWHVTGFRADWATSGSEEGTPVSRQ